MPNSGQNHYKNLLGRVSQAMANRGYVLPPEVQGVHHDDTGAVIALALYFIMKEPKISKKKIKCYLLLLDRISLFKGKGEIIRWERDQHFLKEFIDALIDFMKKKRLIQMNGNSKSQLIVYEVPLFFEDILPLLPPNVIYWIELMLQVCKKKTATKMEKIMLQVENLSDNALVKRLSTVIDKHTRANAIKSSRSSSADDDVKAVVGECLKLIDEHEKDVKDVKSEDIAEIVSTWQEAIDRRTAESKN